MITLNKKQVKGMLDMIKNGSSSITKSIHVVGQYAYVTDSFSFVRFTLEDNTDNFTVDYLELEKWYKLANGKDILLLEEFLKDNKVENTPATALSRVITEIYINVESICFNPKLLNTISNVLGTDRIEMTFNDANGIIIKNEDKPELLGYLLKIRSTR